MLTKTTFIINLRTIMLSRSLNISEIKITYLDQGSPSSGIVTLADVDCPI